MGADTAVEAGTDTTGPNATGPTTTGTNTTGPTTTERASVEESADARLSRLLYEARTAVELLGDRLRFRTGEKDRWSKRLISEIDEYRAERGWSPDGFGGE